MCVYIRRGKSGDLLVLVVRNGEKDEINQLWSADNTALVADSKENLVV